LLVAFVVVVATIVVNVAVDFASAFAAVCVVFDVRITFITFFFFLLAFLCLYWLFVTLFLCFVEQCPFCNTELDITYTRITMN